MIIINHLKSVFFFSVEKTIMTQKGPVKLLDETQSFCDSIGDYLGDNQDFLVVGELHSLSKSIGTLFYLFLSKGHFSVVDSNILSFPQKLYLLPTFI